MPSSPAPQNNLVYSAFFEFEMKKMGSFPNIIWRGASSSSYSQFPGSFKKKVNEGVYLLELIILLIIKETFSSKGHFTHALCSRTGSINVFLYAIGSRGVSRIRDGNGNPRRCFGFD